MAGKVDEVRGLKVERMRLSRGAGLAFVEQRPRLIAGMTDIHLGSPSAAAQFGLALTGQHTTHELVRAPALEPELADKHS